MSFYQKNLTHVVIAANWHGYFSAKVFDENKHEIARGGDRLYEVLSNFVETLLSYKIQPVILRSAGRFSTDVYRCYSLQTDFLKSFQRNCEKDLRPINNSKAVDEVFNSLVKNYPQCCRAKKGTMYKFDLHDILRKDFPIH